MMNINIFNLNEAEVNRWARLICGFCALLWSSLLSIKYVYFGYYDWDLAIYDQIVWGICHGSLSPSLLGVNFLADHAHYIAFLVAPIYAIFPHPLTLINLELISFFTGAYIFYKIAQPMLGAKSALLLMILYILHPANIFMLFYEFHFESLAIVFLFLLFYFMQKEKYVAFLVTACVLLLVKENMAAIVAMFGIYGLLFKKGQRLRWGLVPLILGVGTFLFTMFIFMPFLRKDFVYHHNMYWSIYPQLGSSPESILKTVFFHPLKLMDVLWTPANYNYVFDLFSPYLFTSFFSPHILLLAVPIFLQNMLSSTSSSHSIYYHYAATLVPFIILAGTATLARVKLLTTPKTYAIIFCLVLMTAFYMDFKFWPDWKQKVSTWIDHGDPARERLVGLIPADASIVASFDFLSHLSHHKNIYAFYNVWKDVNYFTGQSPFQLPLTVNYALLDSNDLWLEYDLMKNPKGTKAAIDRFFAEGKWVVVERHGSLVLYRRGE